MARSIEHVEGRTPTRRRCRTAGLTLLEVMIAIAVVTTVMLASAAAFSSSLSAVDRAKRMDSAVVYLETVMEDLSAQPYDDLLAFNGNRTFNVTNAADSRFAVDLTVFLARVDLLQLAGTVVDLDTDSPIATVTTLRSRR